MNFFMYAVNFFGAGSACGNINDGKGPAFNIQDCAALNQLELSYFIFRVFYVCRKHPDIVFTLEIVMSVRDSETHYTCITILMHCIVNRLSLCLGFSVEALPIYAKPLVSQSCSTTTATHWRQKSTYSHGLPRGTSRGTSPNPSPQTKYYF